MVKGNDSDVPADYVNQREEFFVSIWSQFSFISF